MSKNVDANCEKGKRKKYWSLPAGIRSKSYDVVGDTNPNKRLKHRNGNTQQEIGEGVSPSRVEKVVSVLVKHGKPSNCEC